LTLNNIEFYKFQLAPIICRSQNTVAQTT